MERNIENIKVKFQDLYLDSNNLETYRIQIDHNIMFEIFSTIVSDGIANPIPWES